MKDLGKYNSVVCSIHLNSNFFNVGDYLSALGLSKIYNIKNIVWLPDKGDKKNIGDVIYGGGGMIRPNFFYREVYNHFKKIKGKYSIVGVGLNNDKKNPYKYTENDFKAIFQWINTAEYVSVRDNYTFDFIKNKLYNGNLTRKIDINPCPSYIYIKKILNNRKLISDNKKYKIGVVPSFGHTKGYIPFINNMKNFILNLILKYGEENILILCHDKNDLEYCDKNFKNINKILTKEFGDVVENYTLCEGIITARAHGIIFSAATNNKCSYINLSDKLYYLYSYHYGKENNLLEEINFNLDYHLNNLKNNIYPLKLKYEKFIKE